MHVSASFPPKEEWQRERTGLCMCKRVLFSLICGVQAGFDESSSDWISTLRYILLTLSRFTHTCTSTLTDLSWHVHAHCESAKSSLYIYIYTCSHSITSQLMKDYPLSSFYSPGSCVGFWEEEIDDGTAKFTGSTQSGNPDPSGIPTALLAHYMDGVCNCCGCSTLAVL